MIFHFDGPYRFLSNPSPAFVELYGQRYVSVEYAFHAAKFPPVKGDRAATVRNEKWRKDIRLASTWQQAKLLGSKDWKGAPPCREDWPQFRVTAMAMLLARKFEAPDLREQLVLTTGDEVLVEGNTWGDRDWGAIVATSEDVVAQVLAEFPEDGILPAARVWLTPDDPIFATAAGRERRPSWLVGRNMLGLGLMDVRAAVLKP